MEPSTPVTNPTPPAPSTPTIAPPTPTAPPQTGHSSTTGAVPKGFGLFKPSFDAFKLNMGTFLGLYVLPFIFFVFSTFTLLGSHKNHAVSAIVLLMALVGIILAFFVYPALIITQLKSVRGEKIKPDEAFKAGMKYIVRMVILGIIFFLGIVGGFLLFIVPGIIFLTRYIFAPYFLIDQNLGVMAAMKASAAASKGYGWTIWSMIAVDMVFSLLGVIPIIGMIASYVLQLLYSTAPAVLYNSINKPAAVAANTPPAQPSVTT